jgi:hypothetical protein
MAHPIRKTYWVMATTWTGLRRRVLQIRTALTLELDGRRARMIAKALGGHYLREARHRPARGRSPGHGPPEHHRGSNPMNLLSLYLIDYNRLTRKEKVRAWWYAVIIFTPLAAILLAHLYHAPSLDRIMGW